MTESAPVATAVSKPEEAYRISLSQFGEASFGHRRWYVDLHEHQHPDGLMNPNVWAHVADKIMGHDKAAPKGRGDIIEVRKMDEGLYMELFVTAVGQGFVRVRAMRESVGPEVVISASSPLTTRWNGGRGKQCHEVIRKTDRQPLATGFQTREDAKQWIDNHRDEMAA